MKLVNLTPHNITLQADDGSQFTIPPSGEVARIASTSGERVADTVAPVPIFGQTVWGEPIGLPDPGAEPSLYIVSALFAGRVGNRVDVVYPGTGPNDGAIRDNKGHIVAVTRLIRA